jgi:hypothetical protein
MSLSGDEVTLIPGWYFFDVVFFLIIELLMH